jgi:hypothetical protein
MNTSFSLKKAGLSLIVVSSLIGVFGCSSAPTANEQAKTSPPVVVNPRVEPQKVNLSEDFKASRPVDVLADVKSFDSPVTSVSLRLYFSPETEQRVRFFKNPVEVPMKKVEGTTWRARLTADELRSLAISGQSLKYQGQVVAKNSNDQITMSGQSVELTVQAPPVVQGRG